MWVRATSTTGRPRRAATPRPINVGPREKVRSRSLRRTKPCCSSDASTAWAEAWLIPTERVMSTSLNDCKGSAARNISIEMARSVDGEVRVIPTSWPHPSQWRHASRDVDASRLRRDRCARRQTQSPPGNLSLSAQLASRSRAPVSAEGWRSFERAWRSIWRMRSLVRWSTSPTSSSVRGSPRSRP